MPKKVMSHGKDRAKRPGVRPKGPYTDKRKTLTTRITEPTRIRLEEASAAADRSLSQEIELRLEQSFLKEDAKFEEFGGKGKYVFMKLLAAVISLVEHKTGKTFSEDAHTRSQAIIALERVLKGYEMEALADADEAGIGAFHGDEPVGEEIGDELRSQLLKEAVERMLTAAEDRAKSGSRTNADK